MPGSAVRPGAGETDTRDRESVRKVQCGASIRMLSTGAEEIAARCGPPAAYNRRVRNQFLPSPLRGSSRSEHRAKFTGLS
jgi:hypothetical protein